MARLTLATTTPGEPEIFASIQGEGASMGQAVAFVRLSRCNLACTWCDTAYTWHFDSQYSGDDTAHRDGEVFDRKANQITLDVADIAARIAKLGQKRLVITGGEPLLQAAPLADLVEQLSDLVPDMAFEIETNGTVPVPPRLDIRLDQFNVSPKLAHSGNAAELALIPEQLAFYAADRRAFFKFVIATPDDVEEVLTIQRRYAIAGHRIYLMPEGVDADMLTQRSKWLVNSCIINGLAYSNRQHIYIFGDSRGT